MMVAVDAVVALLFFEHVVSPFQILVYLDDAGLAVLTAVTPHKASQSHPPVRVDLFEQKTIERQVQHLTQKTVTAVGLRNTITMSQIDTLALNFKNKRLVNRNP